MDLIDVVCGIITSNDKILITQRGDEKHFGLWEFPGGKVIDGETIFKSMQREVKEELSIGVLPIKEVMRYSYNGYMLIFIHCELIEDSSSITLSEHLDFRWISREERFDYPFISGDVEMVRVLESCGF